MYVYLCHMCWCSWRLEEDLLELAVVSCRIRVLGPQLGPLKDSTEWC